MSVRDGGEAVFCNGAVGDEPRDTALGGVADVAAEGVALTDVEKFAELFAQITSGGDTVHGDD